VENDAVCPGLLPSTIKDSRAHVLNIKIEEIHQSLVRAHNTTISKDGIYVASCVFGKRSALLGWRTKFFVWNGVRRQE
jgi:hypothetical protein